MVMPPNRKSKINREISPPLKNRFMWSAFYSHGCLSGFTVPAIHPVCSDINSSIVSNYAFYFNNRKIIVTICDLLLKSQVKDSGNRAVVGV